MTEEMMVIGYDGGPGKIALPKRAIDEAIKNSGGTLADPPAPAIQALGCVDGILVVVPLLRDGQRAVVAIGLNPEDIAKEGLNFIWKKERYNWTVETLRQTMLIGQIMGRDLFETITSPR